MDRCRRTLRECERQRAAKHSGAHARNHDVNGATRHGGAAGIAGMGEWPKLRQHRGAAQVVVADDAAGMILPPHEGRERIDSLMAVGFPPILLGRDPARLRDSVVHHSFTGRFAVRQGNWKLEFCPGGWRLDQAG